MKKFADEFRRINYVTPTSFLELLSMYKKILKDKRDDNEFAIKRLSTGLDVLKQAEIEVDVMKKELEDAQPKLAQTSIEIEETTKIITTKTAEANVVNAVVEKEVEEANKIQSAVAAVNDDANAKLREAEPALAKAVKALKDIKVGDFYEMKQVNTPGPSIVTSFKILCFFLTEFTQGQKPKKPNDEKKLQYDPEGYFDLAKKTVLANPNKLLESLLGYDRDHMPDELITKVTPMMQLPEMEASKVKKASEALGGIRIWIEAMITYHTVLKVVNPLRETARIKQAELDAATAVVNEKLAQKKAV